MSCFHYPFIISKGIKLLLILMFCRKRYLQAHIDWWNNTKWFLCQ